MEGGGDFIGTLLLYKATYSKGYISVLGVQGAGRVWTGYIPNDL